jgi:hypothetical protein
MRAVVCAQTFLLAATAVLAAKSYNPQADRAHYADCRRFNDPGLPLEKTYVWTVNAEGCLMTTTSGDTVWCCESEDR